jgi:hypothetical protein
MGLLREAEMYTFTLTDDETRVLAIALGAAQRVVQVEALRALEAKIEAEIASQRKAQSEHKPEG